MHSNSCLSLSLPHRKLDTLGELSDNLFHYLSLSPFPVSAGVLPPSGGDALVYGESLSTPGGMDRIRSVMGVCPQFDILWNELTGAEHLRIYGRIKVGGRAPEHAQIDGYIKGDGRGQGQQLHETRY